MMEFKFKIVTSVSGAENNNLFYRNHSSTLPIKRLWFYLLKQEKLRDIFVRYVFRKERVANHLGREVSKMLKYKCRGNVMTSL